jgi:hypothetical protein
VIFVRRIVIALAIVCAGCSMVRGEMPEAEPPLGLTVFNGMDNALRVVIDGRRIAEVEAIGRISEPLSRRWIQGRRVRVCVQPIGTTREYCARESLLVTASVGEVSITVRRTGQVILTVT